MSYYVYFVTNDFNKVLYTGFTNNLERRVYEHKEGVVDGFTSKYKTSKLVYFEVFDDPENAILREKQIKNWNRQKKNFLVNQSNPQWCDLTEDWYQNSDPSASLGMTRERQQA